MWVVEYGGRISLPPTQSANVLLGADNKNAKLSWLGVIA